MDLNKLHTKITRADLLLEYSQEQIMEYYFGSAVKRKKYYANPFREDSTPGCTFFYTQKGVLVLNDFALGKQFDCFQVASLRTGREMRSGDIYLAMKSLSPLDLPKPQIFCSREEREQETTIKVILEPFKESDFEFWNQFNITPEVLKKYNVRRVERAWINGMLVYISLDKDPCYRYTEGTKIKLYRPKNVKKKFRNNYTSDVVMEGMSVLPDVGDKLIITKSMKDVMVFASIGLNAICPKSETSLVDEELVDNLFKRFKEVFIWYDADATGNHQSELVYNKYKEKGIIRITHNQALGKDTSDIVKIHGIQKLIELCKQSEIL